MNIDEKLEEVTMLFKQLKMAQKDNIIEHGLQIKELEDLAKQVEMAKACFMEPSEESDDELQYIFEYVSETETDSESE